MPRGDGRFGHFRWRRTRSTLPSVRAYSVVELGDSESIDLFLREEDARHAAAGKLSVRATALAVSGL